MPAFMFDFGLQNQEINEKAYIPQAERKSTPGLVP